MNASGLIGIYGASGYTAKLIARELKARGMTVRPGARKADEEILRNGIEFELGNIEALRSFLAGLSIVINCAGPFIGTATALAREAVRAGVHYIDITGEPPVVEQLNAELDAEARMAGRFILPATGFFGGLSDLLATATIGELDAPSVDAISVAYHLSKWEMTKGSSLAAAGLRGQKYSFENGRPSRSVSAPTLSRHTYCAPIGEVPVIENYPSPEILLLPRHVELKSLNIVMSASTFANGMQKSESASNLDDTDFVIDLTVVSGSRRLRSGIIGRDIYGVTAPIVGEVVSRLLADNPKGGGATSVAALFDARNFLDAIRSKFTNIQIGIQQC